MNYLDAELWFSPKGRINRRPYFFAGLLASVITKAAEFVPRPVFFFYLPVALIAIWIGIALGIKRCHDRGRSGWFMLLNIVPILNLWPFVELVFLKGDAGANKYGPDPLEAPPAESPAVPVA